MCGLVGIITKKKVGFYLNEVKVFNELLQVGAVRGEDGTGIFYDNEEGRSLILKRPSPSQYLIELKKYDSSMSQVLKDSNFLIGHNRRATMGSLTLESTHPFKEDSITLVHNGTLRNHKALKNVNVDSHAICHSIAEKGIDNTISRLEGAFALIWYDEENKKLHLIRNDERPLHVIETPTMFVVVSELQMGEWILGRNGIKIENKFLLKKGILHTFDTKELEWSYRDVPLYVPVYHSPYHIGILPSGGVRVKKPQDGGGHNTLLGNEILFLPFNIKEGNRSYYLEGYRDLGDGKEEEVRYYSDIKHLKSLLDCAGLIATVSHSVFDSKTNTSYLIVRDVYEEVISFDNITIRAEEVMSLPDNCPCCDGFLGKKKKQLEKSSLSDIHSNYKVLCPECTSYFYNVAVTKWN